MIAKVDAEGADSKAVAEEYGVTGYPTILFFPAGTKKQVDYQGGRSEGDFVNFINEKAGTFRTEGGELNDVAGTVASLDTIVANFLSGTGLTEAAAEIKEAVELLTDAAESKFAEYYVRVFDKLSKNEKFVNKELARLQGILAKGGLAPSKRDEIQIKINVLRKFTPKEDKDEKDEL